MSKNINVELSDEEFEEVKEIKEELGLTWKGVIKRGIVKTELGLADQDFEK